MTDIPESIGSSVGVTPDESTATPSRARSAGMCAAAEFLGQPKGRLAAIMEQGKRIAHLNRLLNALLPSYLQNQVSLQSVSPQQWILQTESAAWATRLRYVLPGLRQQLEAELKKPVPELKLRIEPRADKPPTRPQRRLTLSASAAELLKSTARNIKDEKLGAALLRLAQRGSTQNRSE